MNAFRAAVRNGNGAKILSSAPSPDPCRRSRVETSLAKILIPRAERRTVDQRREARYRGIVDRATIVFRRKKLLAKVVNVSEGGLMLEAPIEPRIGEQLRVEFEGFEPLTGLVRWVRDGRVGIDVGDGAITLG